MPSNIKISKVANDHIVYDIVIAALGYETRAIFAHKRLSPKARYCLAWSFRDSDVFNFKANKEYYSSKNFQEIDYNEGTLEKRLDEIFDTFDGSSVFVWIDISSMTRKMLAVLCYYFYTKSAERSKVINVQYVYSPAKYNRPADDYGPIVASGAVIPELAGWSEGPNLPCTVVLGVGYETEVALGTLEDLEAKEVWIFRPSGHDKRYDSAIDRVNIGLFEQVPKDRIFRYSVMNMADLTIQLESLVQGSERSSRVIIVPFGPKVFTLCSCIVALLHYPRIGVWRISAGDFITPEDRIPNGKIVIMQVIFQPNKANPYEPVVV